MTTPAKSLTRRSANSRQQLLKASIESFVTTGYHATTTREIAQKAGLSPAAMYVHFSSKQDLLFELIEHGHHEAYRALADAIQQADGPREALRAAVYAFTEWHATNHRLGRIAQYEFQYLTPENRARIAHIRKAIDASLRTILQDGARTGALSVPNVRLTALAILSLCIDLVRWFPSRMHSDPQEIASNYADIASRMAGI